MKLTKERLKQIIKEELALMNERKVDPNTGGIKSTEPSDDVKASHEDVRKFLKGKGILDDKGNLAGDKVTADARKALKGTKFEGTRAASYVVDALDV
jgi:hypothetical protein